VSLVGGCRSKVAPKGVADQVEGDVELAEAASSFRGERGLEGGVLAPGAFSEAEEHSAGLGVLVEPAEVLGAKSAVVGVASEPDHDLPATKIGRYKGEVGSEDVSKALVVRVGPEHVRVVDGPGRCGPLHDPLS
jgi:hypothetical protein